jgi:hypothetical protein
MRDNFDGFFDLVDSRAMGTFLGMGYEGVDCINAVLVRKAFGRTNAEFYLKVSQLDSTTD